MVGPRKPADYKQERRNNAPRLVQSAAARPFYAEAVSGA